MARRPSSSRRSSRTTSRHRKISLTRRRLVAGLERLEGRQLLAGDVTLFADSFESGSNSNDWAGSWVEDSQNDWFRSTQRSTDGVRSAEVDGWASNATLTMSNALDLSGYQSAELTFDWLIERGFDLGEYLALDVSSDGGSSWIASVLQLDGNSDPENQWRSETVDLTSYASSELLVRFRAKVSRSNEDANVDNVRIAGIQPVNQPPVVDAGPEQTRKDAGGNGDEFVILSGSASDSDGTIVSYEWTDGTDVLGTTAQITPTLAVGVHTLTLKVTDDDGAIATDTVVVTIDEVPKKPVKVFLMAGHSNLLGTGYVDNLDPAWNVPQDDVWIWLDHNMDGGQWTTVEPGHGRKTHAPHPSEPEGLEGPDLRLGAELSLARRLADAYPEHQIALIKHGRGGAAIADHFHPDNIGPADSMEHMWSGLTKKIDDSFAVLNAGGYSYEVAGMFMGIGGPDGLNRNFGSSDQNEVAAGEDEALARAAEYAENFTYFMQSIRDRFAQDVPFVSTLLADEYSQDLLEQFPGAPIVRQEQLQVDAADPLATFFEPAGLTMRDPVHFDAMGLIGLGNLFADNYFALVEPSIEPTIDYPDFSDTIQLNLIADAASPVGADNVLQITPLLTNQRGAAWHTSKQLVSLGFTTEFDFQTTGNGSDGFAFVIQNNSIDSLGGGGGGLGYKNLPNSLALEFDTFLNATIDPNNNHVSVQTLGTNPNSNDTAISLGHVIPSFDINDGTVHRVKVDYQPGILEVFLDDFSSPALSVAVDLATMLSLDEGHAWLGFTGASGGKAQQQEILNWNFSPTAVLGATIAIDDAQVIEGDGGTTNLIFTARRSGDTDGSSSVNWSTSDVSATSADYVAASGQIVFQEGETEKTIMVTVNGDTDEESHETLAVTLSAATGAVLTDGLAVGTILNDDTTISISDDVVTEADTKIRFLGEFASAIAAQLHESRGLESGPDGNLYVSRFNDPAVLRFDGQTGAPLGVFATHLQLAAAKNLEFGPDGNLYVADNINQTVVRFNGTTGEFMDVFVSAGAGGLMTPRGLAFDASGDLYVSSAGTDQILRFDGVTGTFVDDFVTAGSGGLVSPTELSFGDDGSLYVASGAHQTNNSVLRYDGGSGAFLNTFVSAGSAGLTIAPTGGIVFGQDINGDGSSDLWVSNGDADEVLVFDGVNGEHLATPVTGGLGGLDDPKGLAFDSDGNLLVVDNGNDRILRYGAASQAALTVSLPSPSGLAVVVDYETSDGTATAGADYESTSGTVTFLPGETTKTILVSTLDDDVPEDTESFEVSLLNAVGATLADSVAEGMILDDGDVGNQAPTADAGADQTLSDNDGTGSETVTLTGSGSDPDGTIAAYQWTDGATVLGNTASISPSLTVGTHTLTLTVTDDDGATASDSVVVTVAANQGPSVNAGADQTVTDSDGDGSETVTLSGTASDGDGSIVSYQWSDGTSIIGTMTSISPTLDVGTHTFTLTVTDSGGATSSDSVTVTVEAAPASGPNLSHGNVASVGSSWQTVTLGKSYTSMVVVATPRYNDGSGPGVVRINNVTANSFDVRVDNAGLSSFSGGVHYIAVEEGVYDEPGFKLEAVEYDEAQTSRRSGWGIDTVGYQQSYSSPVVVGQVMSANDEDWSVFWASSGSRTSPPSSSALNVGKHVAEDPDTTRASETIGYLVIEATQDGTIEGLPFVAGVGGDTVRGVGNGTNQYSYDAMPNAKTAVLSSAGMDGNDGGWAVLRGDNPVPASSGTISLSIDEDQLRDSERNHTTEQVAYFVIDPPLAESVDRVATHDPLAAVTPAFYTDVNGDGVVSPLDALLIINRLNSDSAEEGDLVLDVNRDDRITALDALLIINRLNRNDDSAPGEREGLGPVAIDGYFAMFDDEEVSLFGSGPSKRHLLDPTSAFRPKTE